MEHKMAIDTVTHPKINTEASKRGPRKLIDRQVSLKYILDCWAKDYRFEEGVKLVALEWSVDTAKQSVIFTLTVEQTKPEV